MVETIKEMMAKFEASVMATVNRKPVENVPSDAEIVIENQTNYASNGLKIAVVIGAAVYLATLKKGK